MSLGSISSESSPEDGPRTSESDLTRAWNGSDGVMRLIWRRWPGVDLRVVLMDVIDMMKDSYEQFSDI